MFKKILTIAALTVASVFVAVGAASPAHGAQSDCTPGSAVCLWSGVQPFSGTILRITLYPGGTCYNVPSSFNDTANHFYSRTHIVDPDNDRRVQFYQDANCTGHLLHRNTSGCPGGPFPGGSSGEFWWSVSGCHNANYDLNKLTSVFFNTF